MNEVIEIIKLSKYAGERFDLVQAGGGNSSVKSDEGVMFIKSSGYALSEVDYYKGFTKVINKKVLGIINNYASVIDLNEIDEKDVSIKLNETVIDNGEKPSIETFLHSMLYKYTLHTHPLIVNSVTCSSDWKAVLSKLFKEALLINYYTPGIKLAIKMMMEIKNYVSKNGQMPQIIFLQNHGLIVSCDELDEIKNITERVVQDLENLLNVNYERYKWTNNISHMVNSLTKEDLISYLSEDIQINNLVNFKRELLHSSPFCPDGMVYLGESILEISDLKDNILISDYLSKHHDYPKVINYNGNIFLIAKNIKKAREIESVLKFHLLTLGSVNSFVNFLTSEERNFIGTWEAEKYRQKL